MCPLNSTEEYPYLLHQYSSNLSKISILHVIMGMTRDVEQGLLRAIEVLSFQGS